MLEALTRDELLAVQRGRATFLADVNHVVATIAERHRAAGAQLTWHLVRDIREEALADIGLAARWPAELLNDLALAAVVPPLDGPLSAADFDSLCGFTRQIADTFCDATPT